MAAPNIVGVTSIYGKSVAGALGTSAATILNNPVSSGKVLKVNSLYIANVDGTNNADATVSYYSQDDIGGTATALANTIRVPSDTTLVIVSKDAPIYLEEDKSIGGLASASGDLVYVCSYEEIA